ncbi:MAG: 4-hydroxythreonine-4-phosphate dehydrogenase PdxA, partial [Candidatus Hydrogenedentales bacterium]
MESSKRIPHLPRLAITMGDVNGVGPEILVKALSDSRAYEQCTPIVFGSAAVWDEARRFSPNAPRANVIESLDAANSDPETIAVYEAGVVAPPIRPGFLDADAARCAVAWLRAAVRASMAGTIQGFVTCPINKEGLHLAGIPYTGHTEIVAEETQSKDYRMCLFTDRMRIIHITSHYPLSEAITMVKQPRIVDSIRIG